MRGPVLVVLLSAVAPVGAQHLPTVRSNVSSITIQDGTDRRTGYWTLDPGAHPDVYVADRSRRIKEVRFITDVDSIVFELKPGGSYDFVIVRNGRDSCFTRVRSAITPEALAYVPPAVPPTPDTLPMVLTRKNNLLLRSVLDGQDTLWLMFHTGMQGVDLTEEGKARLHQYRSDGTVHAGSWGGGGSSEISAHHALRIGRHEWKDVELGISPLSGEGSEGKIGYDLFADDVLEVDLDHSRIIVRDRVPAHMEGYTALPIEYHRGRFFITCTVTSKAGAFDVPVMVHSGHSGTLIFGTQAVREHPALATLDTCGVEVLKDSYGHELRNLRVTVPAVDLKDQHFTQVTASIMDPRSNFPESVMGGGMLSRFNWVLDLRNDVLYLAPRRAFTAGEGK